MTTTQNTALTPSQPGDRLGTRVGRSVGRCKACRKVHTSTGPNARWRTTTACPCGAKAAVVLEPVIGMHAAKVTCGARCTNAVGPMCDCSCGGENHGAGH